jgi:hypothetical protein
MNLDLLNSVPNGEPFVNTDRLSIYSIRSPDGNNVVGFRVVLDGEEKIFKAKPSSKKGSNEILEAWIEVERYTGKFL